MKKISAFLYSSLAYLFFFAVILYLIGFVNSLFVPKTIDSGSTVPFLEAILINVGLIALFGIQHTIMARREFKAWITRYLPQVAERSTFVLVASLVLVVLFWQWRPMPAVLWSVDHPAGWWLLQGLSLAGWTILFVCTFLINHFELFGLQQGYLYLRGRQPQPSRFRKPSLYRLARHPMMTGVLIGIWATPHMTVGHLVFAIAMSSYILIGIRFEERELVASLGHQYREYQQTTPMLIPHPWKQKNTTAAASQDAGMQKPFAVSAQSGEYSAVN